MPTKTTHPTDTVPLPDDPEAELQEEISSKRRMPEKLRRFLLKVQGGKVYLPAAYRIVWWRDEEGDKHGVETEITEGGQEAGFATLKAIVRDETGRILATAHKTETRQDFPAGWVEKAETGAVARALALIGFGTQFSQELDADDSGTHLADSPQPAGRTPNRPAAPAQRPPQPAQRPNADPKPTAPLPSPAEGQNEDLRLARRALKAAMIGAGYTQEDCGNNAIVTAIIEATVPDYRNLTTLEVFHAAAAAQIPPGLGKSEECCPAEAA